MAGAGWRDFITGEVVTEPYIQTYLQDQVVMVFASAAARTSALAAPSEGMFSYRTDSKVLERYDGTTWKVYPGDATAAGSIAYFNGTTWAKVVPTTAGDLIYFDGTAWQKLAIGSAGQALTVNAGATAPQWAAVSGSFNRESGNTVETSTTSTSAVDVMTVSSLNIAAARPLHIVVHYRKTGSTGPTGIGLKINATTVMEASVGSGGSYFNSNAGHAYAVFSVGEGISNYGACFMNQGSNFAIATQLGLITAARPAATVTSVAIRGIVTSGDTLFIDDVHVYSLKET